MGVGVGVGSGVGHLLTDEMCPGRTMATLQGFSTQNALRPSEAGRKSVPLIYTRSARDLSNL